MHLSSGSRPILTALTPPSDDSGLTRRYQTQIRSNPIYSLWASREAGALGETYVVNQWLRWRDWHEPSLGLWYWRDQGGNEVDLLLERDRKIAAVECKIKEQS